MTHVSDEGMSLYGGVVIGNDHEMMSVVACGQNDLERLHVMANDEDSHEIGHVIERMKPGILNGLRSYNVNDDHDHENRVN